jgi:uncharacterized membrane protein YdjX (TVP38/TMEM64 family)
LRIFSLFAPAELHLSRFDIDDPFRLMSRRRSLHMKNCTYQRLCRWLPAIAVIVAIIGLLALWQLSALHQLTDPRVLAQWLRELGQKPLALLWIMALYLIANALLAPNTALNAATVLALGSAYGLPYALSGSLVAAAAAYLLGRRVGMHRLNHLHLPKLRYLARSVRNSGVVGIATIRMVPVAPYSVVNAALGAAGVGFAPYLIGTLLGLLPGLIAISVLGQRLRALIEQPDAGNVALLTLTSLGLIAALVLLQHFLRRRLSSSVR